ncbi:MAG: hypothetical protein WCJ64_23250 [Rhodospirillaceae bacterium]
MIDNARASDFLNKAEKLLSWQAFQLEEMREFGRHGKLDDVERSFWLILCLVDSIHQSLVDAAKKLGMEDWCDELIHLRNNDPLLYYMWKGRNSEVHDALVKWRPSMKHINMRIVDAAKVRNIVGNLPPQVHVNALLCFVYGAHSKNDLIEAMKQNPIPSPEKQFEAGIEIIESLESLSLDDFQIGPGRRAETISAPTLHMGKHMPPSADQAVRFALEFYKGKYEELKLAAG